jgi:hypothetical protein
MFEPPAPKRLSPGLTVKLTKEGFTLQELGEMIGDL